MLWLQQHYIIIGLVIAGLMMLSGFFLIFGKKKEEVPTSEELIGRVISIDTLPVGEKLGVLIFDVQGKACNIKLQFPAGNNDLIHWINDSHTSHTTHNTRVVVNIANRCIIRVYQEWYPINPTYNINQGYHHDHDSESNH